MSNGSSLAISTSATLSGQEFQIAVGTNSKDFCAYVNNDCIIWSSNSPDFSSTYIKKYDLSTSTTSTLISAPNAEIGFTDGNNLYLGASSACYMDFTQYSNPSNLVIKPKGTLINDPLSIDISNDNCLVTHMNIHQNITTYTKVYNDGLGNCGIYYKDLTSVTPEFRIELGDKDNIMSLYPPTISYGNIAYNLYNLTTKSDIFLYNIASGLKTQIAISSVNSYCPVIQKDYVYYLEYGSNGRYIKYYKISTMQTGIIEYLPNNADILLSYNPDGDYLVYTVSNLTNEYLKCYNPSTNNIIVLQQGEPEAYKINAGCCCGNKIVYAKASPPSLLNINCMQPQQIQLSVISNNDTSTTYTVVPDGIRSTALRYQIRIWGDNIVWHEWDKAINDYDVYGFHVSNY